MGISFVGLIVSLFGLLHVRIKSLEGMLQWRLSVWVVLPVAEAQVVFVGQQLLIDGDLNADPCVIPCLAKGISAGKFVDLALSACLACLLD